MSAAAGPNQPPRESAGAAGVPHLLQRCLAAGTVRTAVYVSAVVGTVLNLINHYDLLVGAPLTTGAALQLGLTYMVPYLVSTHGQVVGRAAPASR